MYGTRCYGKNGPSSNIPYGDISRAGTHPYLEVEPPSEGREEVDLCLEGVLLHTEPEGDTARLVQPRQGEGHRQHLLDGDGLRGPVVGELHVGGGVRVRVRGG